MIRTRPPRAERVAKGWVRERILAALSMNPMSLTEISDGLGVAKSTASYHLGMLASRGVIEELPGGEVKRYGVSEGSLVIVPGHDEEEAELRALRETFDIQALSWRSTGSIDLRSLQTLLYRMFLRLFRVARSEHRQLMREYGNRTGTILAGTMAPFPSKRSILALTSALRASGIAEADLLEIPGSAVSMVVSTTCIGTDLHGGNACHFLEGIIEGVVRSKMGAGMKVGRVDVEGVSGCCFAIGRVRSLDAEWLSRAVLTSPTYSAISRLRGEGAAR